MKKQITFFLFVFVALCVSACASPTPTPVPSTATPAPPTAALLPPTATPVPPTATRVPPTATSAPTLTPTPAGPADGGFGDIVFTKSVDGNLHLFSMKLGTTEQPRLTTFRSLNIFPVWSPDGEKIAYSWDESPTAMYWRIRIMDADGKNSTQITEFRSAARHWSPDGKLLVFNSDRGAAGPDIPDPHIANIDGTGVKNLLNSPKTIDASPKWSPDGKRIAFYSDRGGKLDIYVMDADGKNLMQLTKESGDNSSPAWSRDGKKIAFVSTRDGDSEIHAMNADGSNPMRLTNDPRSDLLPVWPPDGRRIMFASKRTNKGDIYMMNADGSNVVCSGPQKLDTVQVTNDPDVDASFGLDWR